MVEDRKVGVAMDFSKSSKNALKWAIINMADKGDTFYIIHVNHNSLDGSRSNMLAKSGSREFSFYKFVPSSVFLCFHMSNQFRILHFSLVLFAAPIPLTDLRDQEAMNYYGLQTDVEVLDMLDAASRQKEVSYLSLFLSVFLCYHRVYAQQCTLESGNEFSVSMLTRLCFLQVNIVAKLYWGDARQKLMDSIEDLKLETLVMGSRGRSTIQRCVLLFNDLMLFLFFSINVTEGKLVIF